MTCRPQTKGFHQLWLLLLLLLLLLLPGQHLIITASKASRAFTLGARSWSHGHLLNVFETCLSSTVLSQSTALGAQEDDGMQTIPRLGWLEVKGSQIGFIQPRHT